MSERDGATPWLSMVSSTPPPFKSALILLAISQRHEAARYRAGEYLTGTANRLPVFDHFLPLRNPTRQTSQGKHHREHIRRNVQGAVDDARVKVHIRVQATLDEVFVIQSYLLQLLCNVQNGVIDAELSKDFVSGLLEDAGTGVEDLENSVTEAHEAERVVFVFGFVNHLLQVAAVFADGFKHFDDRLVGTSVKRAPKRGNPAETLLSVSLGRAHHTNRRR